ncbi:MAG: mechanosensitive ion channel domain-containing protein [Synechococcus sp. ELA057]
MNLIRDEILGWWSYLQRPPVQLQLLPLLALMLTLAYLPRLWPAAARRLQSRLPLRALLLLGELLLALVLTVTQQRAGLVLLGLQFSLLWVLLSLLETTLMRRWLNQTSRHELVSRLLRPLLFLYVVITVLDALGSLQDFAAASLGTWFGSVINLGQLCRVLLVLYLLLVGLALPAAWVSHLLKRLLNLQEGSRGAVEQILRYVLMTLGVIWAMSSLGINQTGVLAVAGGLSVGLGFGIKEVFSNMVSGLWLLMEGSVRPGEVLLHDGEVCEVHRLGPRATVLLRSSDNAELVVPNQNFFTTATTTYTRSDRMRRASITLALSRQWPPDQIITLLKEIAQAHPQVMDIPASSAKLQAFGPEIYSYTVSYSVPDPLIAGGVTADLRLAIVERFASLGIDPPM